MNGLTYAAPAFAAIRHCTLEKHSVTLVLMPASARRRTATIPASSIGIFTTMLSAILASSLPSRTMPSASTATTSADTGPSTREQISLRTSRGSKSPACFAKSDGLVVIPSINPAWAAQLRSLRLAVSRTNFMDQPRRRGQRDSAPPRGRVPVAGGGGRAPRFWVRGGGGGEAPRGAPPPGGSPPRPPENAPPPPRKSLARSRTSLPPPLSLPA